MVKKILKKERRSKKRPERLKLSEKEIIKRMQSFDERREAFIAAVRNGKN
jgi:hypothetical protein